MSYSDIIIVREPSVFGTILCNEQFPFTFENVALFLDDELVASGTGMVDDKYSNLKFHTEPEKMSSIIFSWSEVVEDGNVKTITVQANSVHKYFKIVIQDVLLTIDGEKKTCILKVDKCAVNLNLSFGLGEDIECELIPCANEKEEFVTLLFPKSEV